ncbi:MAG: ATP-binding protein [Jaaginema sp. PMC 1079.18]|nr:ATP-binding protein [Jaaginema sp. PMC 1080.18]MEC4851510.1 ATP-binding protein [Jaaginema sp. PMC 1079.18]MEC4868010.1 ATP-binding protein [Jaaginema sp. PMC 1078.18]
MQGITVPGTLEALDTIAEYTIAVAKAANLDRETSYNLRLAVDEIVTNIIQHGYNATQKMESIELQAFLSDRALAIAIEDKGIPYDPTQKAIPRDLHLPPEQRQIGGLGIYLAMKSVDRLIYERVGDRNRNTVIINRYKQEAF